MPLNKRSLCTSITLIFAAGILISLAPQSSVGQAPQNVCRPNAAGDGWDCTSGSTGVLPVPTRRPGLINRGSGRPNPLPPTTSPTTPQNTAPSTTPATAPEPAPTQTPTLTPPPVAAASTAPSPSNVTANSATALPSTHPWDWVPLAELSPEQREAVPSNCCGAYIDPAAELAANGSPASAETLFSAPTGVSQTSPNLISIDGDVVVQQGYRTVQSSGNTTINRATNSVLLEGDVVFREPGVLLTGSSAYIDNESGSNRIESAQYTLHNYGAHGSASSIVYNSESGLVTIENGEFSRCEPNSNFWHLEADQIVLDQTRGLGYATAVKIKVKDVPIFYYPYSLQFPLGDQRMSGLLAPSTGSTRSGGFDFELPYYFNLAPNYDATVAPRLISDRGVLLSGEARYLADWSMNTLNMSRLGNDKLYDEATATTPGSDSPPTDNRWFVGFEHFGALGDNWSTLVDYNAVSDDDYFRDFGSGGLNVTSRTHLNRQAMLNFNSAYGTAGLNAQRIQIIDPFVSASDLNRPYDRLPQFYFNTGADLIAGFRLGLGGQVTAFDRDLNRNALTALQLDNGALVNGERINLEPQISWATEAPGWFVRANAKYKHTTYKLQNQAVGTIEDPEIGVGVYSLDSGLVFERGLSSGYTQTLEPRLFYLFSDFEDQSHLPLFDTSEMSFSFNQLFRDDRFSGGDRIGDADQLTAAITSRILDEQGKERLRVSLGQIQYFADRQVSLNNPLQPWQPRYSPLSNQSALAAELAYAMGDNWKLNSDLQWNEDSQELDESSLQLRYQRDSNHLLNLAYRYRKLVTTPAFILPPGIDPRIKQSDISGVWPVAANWKLLARWNYDHSNSRNLETFAGIEYSNCCATIRVIGREWVDEDELFLPNIEPNRGIFVQFTLHGLGNIAGGGVSNLLSDGIWGFKETEL